MENKLTFHQKLVKAQNEIIKMEKDAKNGFQNYKYVTIGAILLEMKPIFEKYELSISYLQDKEKATVQSYKYTTTKGVEKLGWYATSFMEVVVSDGVESKVIASSIIVGDNEDPAKAIGSMITYGRRYLLECVLNITGDMNLDPDAMDTSKAPAKKNQVEVKKEEPRPYTQKQKLLAEAIISSGKTINAFEKVYGSINDFEDDKAIKATNALLGIKDN